jgi:ABC-2 type transport system ATP-binding protein
LWERLSVRLNLLTYARLQGLAAPEREVDRVLGEVDLADRANDAAGSLSKGLKQRVAIARALIHRPPIVLLDEPTSGLDPASARHIRDMILALKQDGRAVLVSTHNLAEAEELADRIAVLNTQLVALDTPAALRGGIGGGSVTIEVEGAASPWAATLGKGEASGSRLRVPIESLSDVPALVAALAAAGARIVRVVPDRRSLEEVYLGLVGEPE